MATYTAELASVFRSAIDRAKLRLVVDCPPLPEPIYVDITISDTGSGIHADFLPYAFDRFTQAEVPSRHTPGGVGMGLAIDRYLVELHHGTIEVASEGEGQGTTFTIRLPINHLAQPSSDTHLWER